MRKQDMMFAILKELADQGVGGDGRRPFTSEGVDVALLLLGVVRTERTPGRGGSTYSTWRLAEAKPFLRLDPASLPARELWRASSIAGAFELGTPVGLGSPALQNRDSIPYAEMPQTVTDAVVAWTGLVVSATFVVGLPQREALVMIAAFATAGCTTHSAQGRPYASSAMSRAGPTAAITSRTARSAKSATRRTSSGGLPQSRA